MDELLRRMFQLKALRDKDPDPAKGGSGGNPAPNNDDVSAQVAALKAELEALKKTANPKDPQPSDVEKVRKELQEKADREAAIGRMQNAIRFNLSSEKYIEDNKDYLGPLAGGLYKEINSKAFTDEERKASAVKKGVLEYFFSLQENIDAAPAEVKDRIMHFKALADDEKEKQAPAFWDTLTLTVNQKKMTAQIAAAKRANSGNKSFEEPDDNRRKYNDRVFALKSHYLGENKGEQNK